MTSNFLKIKYKDILHWVLWICLTQGIISSYLGFSKINYICDVLLIILLVLKLASRTLYVEKIAGKIEYIPILLFVVVAWIGWSLNTVPIPMALWGVRNYGRFFLYFIFCSIMLDSSDVDEMENAFIKIFPLHCILIAYQYVVQGLNQDLLSGIFGTTQGGNGGLMIYLVIMMCIVMARYEYKELSLVKFITYLVLILINAALSELKFLFVVAVLLLIWYLLMSRRKGRGMVMALAFLIIIYLGAQILYYVFPEYANFLDIDNILNQVSAQEVYASQLDVGRTSVFSKLTPILTNWAGKKALWFGIGLGNADYSSAMTFLNSAFYRAYGVMHYMWLSLGYLFVETGYIGTAVYAAFFVVLAVVSIFKYQSKTNYRNLLGTFFPIVCLILLIYNSALRSNYAYMIFAVLAWNRIGNRNVQTGNESVVRED